MPDKLPHDISKETLTSATIVTVAAIAGFITLVIAAIAQFL